jgi:hypothetical protein
MPFLGIDADTFPDHECMVTLWMANGTVMDFLGEMPHLGVSELVRPLNLLTMKTHTVTHSLAPRNRVGC